MRSRLFMNRSQADDDMSRRDYVYVRLNSKRHCEAFRRQVINGELITLRMRGFSTIASRSLYVVWP